MSVTKMFNKLSKEDLLDMYFVFGTPSKEDKKIIKNYFKNDWIGFGCWDSSRDAEYHEIDLLGYCFIKNRFTRPETLTQVKNDMRNMGIASELRNYALEQRKEFNGNVVYSATNHTNIACIKSLLKSGYNLFDATKDGNLQFIKILEYS